MNMHVLKLPLDVTVYNRVCFLKHLTPTLSFPVNSVLTVPWALGLASWSTAISKELQFSGWGHG